MCIRDSAVARLAYLDEASIWAQVLYPNVGGFGSENFLSIDDDELKLLSVRAYNDFLLEWCATDFRRLLPVLATPFWDVEATVREVARCAAAGARGILFTGEPQRYGLPVIGSHHWDPLWSIATETGLPIHFHIGNAGDLPSLLTPERYAEPVSYTHLDVYKRQPPPSRRSPRRACRQRRWRGR